MSTYLLTLLSVQRRNRVTQSWIRVNSLTRPDPTGTHLEWREPTRPVQWQHENQSISSEYQNCFSD